MKQKDFISSPQVLYLGRYVNRKDFRVYVYGPEGKKKLANTYEEYEELLNSGEWFETVEIAEKIECINDELEANVKLTPKRKKKSTT